ncbi:hypothetical protein [Lacimonas salitolerans]|uniref:Uncharacterized protein n=1 Tax=Lacimonas salitolerans TaxID=1323750 RepID=A0ABW4EGI3_9RHOB
MYFTFENNVLEIPLATALRDFSLAPTPMQGQFERHVKAFALVAACAIGLAVEPWERRMPIPKRGL